MVADHTQPAMAYPHKAQYAEWVDEAERRNMSVSEWMQAMIEAGRKSLNYDLESEMEAADLREQRNDLKDELARARDRITRLEDRIHQGERAEIIAHVEENPGVTFQQLVEHVAKGVPRRVSEELKTLEGDRLRRGSEDRWFLLEQ